MIPDGSHSVARGDRRGDSSREEEEEDNDGIVVIVEAVAVLD